MSYRIEINKWIDGIDISHFDYIIFADGSISNFRRLFDRIKVSDNNGPKLFMSDGFLLEIPSIIEQYCKTKRLPRILVLDTVMLYGLKVNRVVNRIEAAIIKNLEKTPSLKNHCLEELKKNLFINTFIVRDGGSLLKHTDMYGKKILYLSECRKFIYDLNTGLQNEEVAAVGDVLSVKTNDVDGHEVSINNNYQMEISGTDILYNFKNQGAYFTIYSYMKGSKRFYTPFLFMGDIRGDIYLQVLNILFEDIFRQDKTLSNDIIAYLNKINKKTGQLDVYFRLSNLLLSQVYLKRFLFDVNISDGIYNFFDVSPSFGECEKMDFLLRRYSDIFVSDETFSDINALLVKSASVSVSSASTSVLDPESIVKRNLYEKGVGQEEKIAAALEYRAFKINYFEKIKNFLENEVINDKNVLKCLLCLLKHVKMGNCWITSESRINKGEIEFYKRIEPTDSSISILPLELRKYFTRFVFPIVQLYWRDSDFSERMNYLLMHYYGLDEDYISDAVYYADSIARHKKVIDSMLNWKSIV